MSGRVVVVEDEELISTMIRINLAGEGFDMRCFGDAESMLAHVADNLHCCDILLLDIMLPGISGEEAVVRLRQLGFTAPVLMLTAKRDLDTRVSTLNKGADDYLAKPFDVGELVARVNALLRRAGGMQAGEKEG